MGLRTDEQVVRTERVMIVTPAMRQQVRRTERVCWEYWRAGFERSYHGSNIGEVNLGDLDSQPSLEDFICWKKCEPA